MFIIMAGLVFFTRGEIFSLFPATCTDTFGAIRNNQCWPAVYREGCGGVGRAADQSA